MIAPDEPVFLKDFHKFAVLEELKEFTLSQLALRNGSDREEIWCAYRGIIYNLTNSRYWLSGRHYEHWAGQDLTGEFPEAPHNDSVFLKFTIIGKLKK